ncbi:MAG: hypothetical protein ABGX47_02770 [Martelella sp.]|uniref:hypothetical protein n=1 Tax=Martelella sp. TaxID=1969699 RepID=UPI003242DDE5
MKGKYHSARRDEAFDAAGNQEVTGPVADRTQKRRHRSAAFQIPDETGLYSAVRLLPDYIMPPVWRACRAKPLSMMGVLFCNQAFA